MLTSTVWTAGIENSAVVSDEADGEADSNIAVVGEYDDEDDAAGGNGCFDDSDSDERVEVILLLNIDPCTAVASVLNMIFSLLPFLWWYVLLLKSPLLAFVLLLLKFLFTSKFVLASKIRASTGSWADDNAVSSDDEDDDAVEIFKKSGLDFMSFNAKTVPKLKPSVRVKIKNI
ncbi:hypothetical protein FF38_11824 [Lucilia cuprina]|uniref:Uncharacterized protein n=1 Tax=Lucilia cuprina TaxID=7375 RepID=A0A0L0BY83_LUCCU|nr:hypothetical protein FF38_11824 [Lucilia cuprina]